MSDQITQLHAIPAAKHQRRWRRWGAWCIVALLVVFIGGELALRYGLGLGDPPLMMSDSLMTYCFKPAQTVWRFHHRIHYNAFCMRSPDGWAASKSDPRQLRVLLIGNSIINGGSATDQSQLATALLQTRLVDDLHRPVLVGNASTGGWGPVSEWGWVCKFGLLKADVVVLVLDSNDYANIPPSPSPVGRVPDMPDRNPWCAWQDLIVRYLVPRFHRFSWVAEPIPAGAEIGPDKNIAWCAACVTYIFHAAQAEGARTILAQSPEQEELNHGPKPGHDYNAKTARAAAVDAVMRFGPAFQQAERQGQDPYRSGDNIHPNVLGQQIMADQLLPVIERLAKQSHGLIQR